MRIFADFAEAQNEIRRDLAELAVKVQPETMQDKFVADDPDYLTHELSNYDYQVLDPRDPTVLDGIHIDWVNQEWEDRLVGDLNPGRSWYKREGIWRQFLERHKGQTFKNDGQFSYTYSERMGGERITFIIDELREHPHSRQLWLPVWYPVDAKRRGKRRVPCSLGYWFVQREGRLHISYIMRSCDFATHYANDVALASMLLQFVARKTELEVGTFTHFIGSLHVYAKDVEGVF